MFPDAHRTEVRPGNARHAFRRLQGDDEPSSASKSLPDSFEQGRAFVVAEMAESVEHLGGAPLVGEHVYRIGHRSRDDGRRVHERLVAGDGGHEANSHRGGRFDGEQLIRTEPPQRRQRASHPGGHVDDDAAVDVPEQLGERTV